MKENKIFGYDKKRRLYVIGRDKKLYRKGFSTEKYELGESPFYDVRTKTLSWVDIPRGMGFTQKVDVKGLPCDFLPLDF